MTIKEGFDKLTQEILFNEKTISIAKKQFDKSRVVVILECTLNIIKEYFQSNITYLITKGDIKSTIVQAFVEEKEIHAPIKDRYNVLGDPTNPHFFEAPVEHYLQALQEKKKVEKVKEKREEEVEPEKELHIIIRTFNDLFKETLKRKEPTEKDVEEVFEWLRSCGENATKFLEADIYRDLTFNAETHYFQFPNLRNRVKKERSKTLNKIRKRFDELRKIQGKIAMQTPILGGIEKEEKKVVPNK